jgi:hypothetical protein
MDRFIRLFSISSDLSPVYSPLVIPVFYFLYLLFVPTDMLLYCDIFHELHYFQVVHSVFIVM